MGRQCMTVMAVSGRCVRICPELTRASAMLDIKQMATSASVSQYHTYIQNIFEISAI